MNLYSILGVARDASIEAVRRAFRSRAKVAHPDRGGDRKVWDQLLLAHRVLSDEEKRAHYDATGKAEDEAKNDSAFRRRVLFLQALIEEVVMSREFPVGADLLAEAQAILRGKRVEVHSIQAGLKKQVARVERVIKRWKYLGTERDLISDVLTQKLSGFQAGLEQTEEHLAVLADVEVMLGDYTFECEPVPPAAAFNQDILRQMAQQIDRNITNQFLWKNPT
jgi:curved DNA-binding protein CbpA